MLTIDEQPHEDRLGDSSALTCYAYSEQVDELELQLPVTWTLLPDPL